MELLLQHMINDFTNDSAYISTRFLLRLIQNRGLRVKQLLKITRIGASSTPHCLALLDNGNYLCDCCMGTNLGIPCRHYFVALSSVKGLKFHLGLIRSRWYQDPNINLADIPSTGCEHITHATRADLAQLNTSQLPSLIMSNPLETQAQLQTPPTITVPAREVLHTAEAALRPLLHGIQTREQLEELVGSLVELR
ncbi:hypothetical protein CPB84DRAFT_81962 [Gymnopilus junonius]|uniref:SWIM-type domain-containing protein n=1 Tax=Gymnopilus junonius TaxID=109634 RepID=A0A9P5TW46_GYMJU|nr:hypothetical protein CPB84DRAFT_81962 [Gymnopilus junonius]